MQMKSCIDCGKEYKVTHMQGKKIRCDECGVIQQRVYARDYARIKAKRNREKIKAERKSCHCGCGRPRGAYLHLLSDYCFRSRTNDNEGDHYAGGRT